MNWWIGVGTPTSLPMRHDRAAQPRQLEPAAALDVFEHRRLRAGREALDHGRACVSIRSAGRLTPRARADRDHFFDRRHHHARTVAGVVAHHTHRRSRDGGHAAPGREAHELHPQIGLDVAAGLRLEAGADARLLERDEAIGSAAVALAEDQLLRDGVTDVSGLVDDGDDVGGAARDVFARRRVSRPCPSRRRRSAA